MTPGSSWPCPTGSYPGPAYIRPDRLNIARFATENYNWTTSCSDRGPVPLLGTHPERPWPRRSDGSRAGRMAETVGIPGVGSALRPARSLPSPGARSGRSWRRTLPHAPGSPAPRACSRPWAGSPAIDCHNRNSSWFRSPCVCARVSVCLLMSKYATLCSGTHR